MAARKELLPLEAIFVEEYLKDFNGARAARSAGYAESNSRTAAAKLIARPRVKKALAERLKQYAGGVKPEVESVLQGYCSIANNPRASNTDRLHALDSLSRYLGMFIERSHVVRDERRVTINLQDSTARAAALALIDQLRVQRQEDIAVAIEPPASTDLVELLESENRDTGQ